MIEETKIENDQNIEENQELIEENNINSIYPSLNERFQSNFIDILFIIIIMYLFSLVLDNFENVFDWVKLTLFALIWIVYDPLSTSLGATLGNLFIGLRIRKFEDHTEKISFQHALLRYFIKLLLGSISFLTIHSNKQKRAIHDFAAGSVVIKKM